MEVGAHVWCNSNDDEAWFLGEITAKSDDELGLFQVDKPENKFTRARVKSKADGPVEIKYQGVELANAPLSEAEKAEGLDNDIISLVHLHEPALLHAVSERFLDGKIYTWTGPVLIAVNPFERLRLYTTEILESYRREGLLRSQGMGDSKSSLAPHIYSIADRSYRQMMSEQRKSQSILISGESGAGKTESTKIVMLYLTTLGSANMTDGEGASEEENMSIMDKVLQSNPVLESFGNAKTLRNDNSSRFGKYIELGFSRSGSLLGAKVQTYLLEKVRLGFHMSGERNYHIFYHLLRGADEDMRKRFRFRDGETQGLELCAFYHYTGQGGAPNLRNFTDDAGFKFMIKGMKTVGWSDELIDNVLALCAGILHLGQINFNAEEGDGGTEMAVPMDEQLVIDAADHLGVDLEKLKICLAERQIVTRGEVLKVALSAAEAQNARDALAKTIYGALFLWVVDQVNRTCGWPDDSEVKSSCGVLDIFGFECFAVNSFEQLCINFTNEALQQQFNKFIFKMEQAEYEREKIEWAFISFPDNQDCLDTIQSRPKGILPMLDDECKLGSRGNDRNWANRLYKELLPKNLQTVSENGRFTATAVQKAKGIFCVIHFAGEVAYTAETGFLEKNRDEIPLTAKNLFETAPTQLIKDLIAVQIRHSEEQNSSAKSKKGGPTKTKTVGQQFKEQLTDLMDRVEKTEPHYIRCLKPNDAAKPKMLTKRRLTDQLRCGGVLEAVKVARMGFPVRLNHSAFFERYRMLSPSTPDSVLAWNLDGGEEAQKLCVKLVDILLAEGAKSKANGGAKPDPKEDGISRTERVRRMQFQPPPMDFPKTDIQLGLTKVFMRKPPHDALEAHRVFHQNVSATLLQSWIRCAQLRLKYLLKAESALTVQRWYRGCVGRARWWKLKEEISSVLLTKHFRMEVYRRRYNRVRRGTVRLQAVSRGHALRRVLGAIKVQTRWRMHKRFAMYRKLKSATISLQTIHRGSVARRVLESLKAEQKDIGHLKESNEQLKLEMASLKAMLAAQAQGAESKKEMDGQILVKEREIEELQSRLKDMEHELENERGNIKELEQNLEDQKAETAKQVEELRKQREESAAQMEKLKQHHQNASTEVAAEIDRLRQENQLQREKLARSSSQRSMPAQTYQPPSDPERSISDPKEHLNSSPPTVSVSPEILAQHQEAMARLEDELESERQMRMELDAEVIKLRANMNGVPLDEDAVSALIQPAEEGIDRKPVITVIPEEMEEDDSFQTTPAKVPEPASVTLHEVPPTKSPSKTAETQGVAAPASVPPPPVEQVTKASPVMNGSSIPAPQDIAPEVTGAEDEKEPQMQAAIHDSVKMETPVEALQTPQKKPIDSVASASKENAKRIDHELQEIKKESVTPGVVSALTKLGVSDAKENRIFNGDTEKPRSKPQKQEEPKPRPLFQRSPSEYFPMIRRGLSSLSEETEPVEQDVAVGWKVDVTNRKEREEALRDEARRLEVRLGNFYGSLEEGIDVVMWQLNRNAEFAPGEVNAEEFLLKATPVQLKLDKRGDMLVQAVLLFNTRGGYLSRALGRHRVDKSALEPLSLHEVLEVRAGCVGYDHTELPISGKPNKGKSKSENKLGSLFLTLKASPTPMALSRAYFLRFKSRSARNDLLVGLRALLADLQIHEGVGISAMHMPGSQPESAPTARASFRRMPGSKRDVHADDPVDAIPAMVPNSDMMVPLGEVHNALNKQRELYDRLILIMLQGSADLKDKEDEILGLHGRLDEATAESEEKDKIQANDSKLIMQLSKKLETLLMDNEDLRDQNDRLNTRLVAVECEKMNLMGN